MNKQIVHYIDNKAIKGKELGFHTVDIDAQLTIESWRFSLFSFEWLTPEGNIRETNMLPEKEQEQYQNIMLNLAKQNALERPVLGIGIMENIEIGSRRDVFLSLSKYGIKKISVHIPARNLKEFTPYL